MEYLDQQRPVNYSPYRLADLQEFIKKLGPDHFVSSMESEGLALGSLLHFRVLLMIGNYAEAVNVLYGLPDFRV